MCGGLIGVAVPHVCTLQNIAALIYSVQEIVFFFTSSDASAFTSAPAGLIFLW